MHHNKRACTRGRQLSITHAVCAWTLARFSRQRARDGCATAPHSHTTPQPEGWREFRSVQCARRARTRAMSRARSSHGYKMRAQASDGHTTPHARAPPKTHSNAQVHADNNMPAQQAAKTGRRAVRTHTPRSTQQALPGAQWRAKTSPHKPLSNGAQHEVWVTPAVASRVTLTHTTQRCRRRRPRSPRQQGGFITHASLHCPPPKCPRWRVPAGLWQKRKP
jgi:hypothetical protein